MDELELVIRLMMCDAPSSITVLLHLPVALMIDIETFIIG